jgi:hypothetical protein
MLEGKLLKVPAGFGVLHDGKKAESKTGMPYDEAQLVMVGGESGNERTLGTLEVKVFRGSAALDAIALNRPDPLPAPPRPDRPSTRRSRLDDRLRRLGVI